MWPMRWSIRPCSRRDPVHKCVCHSVRGDSPCDHYPRCIRIWVPTALDFRYGTYPPPDIKQGTYPLSRPRPKRWQTARHYLSPMLLTSGDHHWTPVQTCSLEDLTPTQLVLTSSGTHLTEMPCCLFQVCVLDRSFGVHWGVTGCYVLESMRTCLHWGRGRFTTAIVFSLFPCTPTHFQRVNFLICSNFIT